MRNAQYKTAAVVGLAAVAVIGLSACSNDSANAPSTQSPTIAAAPVPVRALTRCLMLMSLIYCAEAQRARDKPSERTQNPR